MNSNGKLEISAMRISQRIGEFFIASIPANTLVRIAYADVRRMEDRDVERYLGIQRPLSQKRVKEIQKYLQGSDATFPTAVILAVDERCASFDRTAGILVLQEYDAEDNSDEEDVPYNKIAKILDGQHRIAAFLNDDDTPTKGSESFDVNVAIFVGADISEQANIFATVNLAQTKVNRSLAYDLSELAKTRSPFKTCHNVAVALDSERKSPLFERIKRLGTATPGRQNEPLTQAAFVESLVRFVSKDPLQDRNDMLDGRSLRRPEQEELSKTPFRNLFIDGKDVDIAEIVFNFFVAVRKKWPNSWNAVDQPGNLLPKSNAFKALMKFLKDDVYADIVEGEFGRIPSSREFSPFFEPIDLLDSDFTTRNFVPGSGGQSMFLKMLKREVTRRQMIED